MRKYTTETFIKRAHEVHGTRYDYSRLDYKNAHTDVEIGCPTHGWFVQRACAHLLYGCNQCGDECAAAKRRTSLNNYIERAKAIHGDKYSYARVRFKRQHDRIEIICPMHGSFMQCGNDHLKGHGCSACAAQERGERRKDVLQITTEEYVARAKKVHGDTYVYSGTEYFGIFKLISIECKRHGIFQQLASNHLLGHGCPSCGTTKHKAQNEWLDWLGVDERFREKVIRLNGRWLKVDALDENTNTVYEFWGDYWHGNPSVFNPNDTNKVTGKSFGDLHEQVLNKRRMLQEAGYRLVEIWERDWRNINGKKARSTIVPPSKSS